MSLSVILACGWLVLTNLLGMIPSKRNHWPQAYAMIALGLPCWACCSGSTGSG